MACRDSDGNFVSADSVNAFGEHLERIPEEKVCLSACFIYFFSHFDAFTFYKI